MPAAGFEPLILGLWVECPTNVLTQLANSVKYFLYHTLFPDASSRIWTLDLRIMSWMPYQCANTDCQFYKKSTIFFLLMPVVEFEPLILGLWVEYSTTDSQFYKKSTIFFLRMPVAGFEPLDHRIMSWVFYHCATTVGQLKKTFYYAF